MKINIVYRVLSLAPVLAALGLGLAAMASVQGAGFVSITPMTRGRNNHTATLLPNGKVLVAGGFSLGTSAELYDPVTDKWTATGSLRTARTFHTATLLPNGKVLVAGGGQSFGGGQASASTELYDPATGTWTLTGAMKRARSGPAAALLPNGKVLVVGGTGDGMGSSELYDPASGTWALTGSARSGHRTVTVLANGTVLGSGGEIYDPATGTWAVTGAPGAGYFTAKLLLNGKVLAAGGSRVSTAELYDPDSGTWSPTGSLTWDRDGCTATLLRNGQVLVAGGFEQGPDVPIRSAELYDPTTGTWTEMPMNGAHFSHTATLLPSGRVLVAGGNDFPPLSVLSSAEIYEPDNDAAAPSITVLHNANHIMSFSWTGIGTLEQSDSLDAVVWQRAPVQDNPLTVAITGPGKFFRLRFGP